MLRVLWPGPTEAKVTDAVAGAGGFFFVASSPGTGSELWWTDGTTAGTRLVRDIRPGRGDSSPALLGVVSGVVYFAADDGVHGAELPASDGTRSGTYLVGDLVPGGFGERPRPGDG